VPLHKRNVIPNKMLTARQQSRARRSKLTIGEGRRYIITLGEVDTDMGFKGRRLFQRLRLT
jgi:hypothetical protein